MANLGKKPTDGSSEGPIIGKITINLYEDSFEVKATGSVDFFTIYAVSAGIMEYLENIARDIEEDLDKVDKIMLQ